MTKLKSTKRIVGRALISAALLVSVVATAANPTAAKLARNAEQLYRDARFLEAADALRGAYDLEPRAQFLFNLARTLEQAGQTDRALETYRQYVGRPSSETEPELVARARATLEARLRTQGVKKASPRPVVKNEPNETETEAVAPLQSKEANPKLPGLLVTAAAVVTSGVALTFGLLANDSRTAFSAATTMERKRAFEATARTQALVADVCWVVGAGALMTAMVLLLKSDEHLRVAFSLSRHGVGLALGGSF